MSLNVPREKVDFVEISFNNWGTGLYYDILNLVCKLTASGAPTSPGAARSARSALCLP